MRRILPLLLVCACSPGPSPGPTPAPVHDVAPPGLDVLTPLRGTIQTGTRAVVVSGSSSDDGSGLASVTVNGRPATIAKDGTFSVEVPTGDGITLLHTEAVDAEGNRARDTRAVLGGDLVPVESTVADGIAVRLDARALAAAADIGAAQLAALDLKALIDRKRDPLFDLPGCRGARVELTQAKQGAVKLAVVPVDGGLAIAADVADVRVALHVEWSLFCKDGQTDISASARHFRLTGTVRLALQNGAVSVDASDAEMSFDGFDLETNLLPARVVDFLQAPIGATLAAVLGDVVKDQVPQLLLRGLGGQTRVIPAGEQQLALALTPRVLAIDPTGVELVVDSSLFLEGSPGAVYPASPAPRPQFDTSRPISVAIADDAMNQMLASLWTAGVFERGFDKPAGGGGITALFDRAELSLRLPPVLSALPGGGGLRITAGDIECRLIVKPESGPARELARLAVALEATLKVSIVDDHLALAISDAAISMDLLRDGAGEPPSYTHVQVQEIGDFVSQNLVGLIAGLLGDLPLPAASAGLSVPAAELGSSAGAGYVVLSGGVQAR